MNGLKSKNDKLEKELNICKQRRDFLEKRTKDNETTKPVQTPKSMFLKIKRT